MRASRATRDKLVRVIVAWACSTAAGCAETPEFSQSRSPHPDGAEFVTEVYPMLLRNCAFSTCHGAPERFLRVLGPGRTRLEERSGPNDPISLSEVTYTYDRARLMLVSAEKPQDSLLLRKPLEIAAGGQAHRGLDAFGRNVFASTDSAGYASLLRWALSSGAPPEQADVDDATAAASDATAELLGVAP
jgi:hypothetical protein